MHTRHNIYNIHIKDKIISSQLFMTPQKEIREFIELVASLARY
jgi:hypothetical protein